MHGNLHTFALAREHFEIDGNFLGTLQACISSCTLVTGLLALLAIPLR